ncbi:hypothetical protein [Gordoniibacillus kamchatkensis]|uniref:hypothetical protein n=1 Tax=Gordoniibacillus kamchatkensis TaxID=1590651 RepID=UPI000695ACA8|nr:hypothetical protein [Paenibacillus sp. VKM B-2647]
MKKLSEVLVRSGVLVYREITAVVLLSLISSIVLIPAVLMLPVPAAAFVLCLLYVPLAAGALYAAHQASREGGIRAASMLRGTVKHYGASALFGLLCGLFALILVSSWWYYGSRSGTLYFGLAVFQTYFVAMVLVSQFYTLPLVVQEGVGIGAAMGQSVKLFFKHPGYTVGACLQAAAIGVLLLVTVVGYAALYVGALAMYWNAAAANVIRPADDKA